MTESDWETRFDKHFNVTDDEDNIFIKIKDFKQMMGQEIASATSQGARDMYDKIHLQFISLYDNNDEEGMTIRHVIDTIESLSPSKEVEEA